MNAVNSILIQHSILIFEFDISMQGDASMDHSDTVLLVFGACKHPTDWY
jgi:hypothetical protein